jgi:ABC-2 type transport system ATP-binding protein
LSKIYGEQYAVNDISFEAKKGEIVGFLGPNGAGKSTTMKIATCYLSPSKGTVYTCGYDVRKSPQKVQKNIGYLPEHNPLYLDMYVREYLAFIASLHEMNSKQTKQRTTEVIGLCGLEREQNKKIQALSKGYRQRVGLAQALIHNPEVLILDEPTTGLDPNQINEIRQLIKNISHDKTIVFSTHIMQEVQALCDRAVIINLGKIVADKSIKNLAEEAKQNVIHLEFGQAINVEMLQTLNQIQNVETLGENRYVVLGNSAIDLRKDIFDLAVAQKWTLLEMHKKERSLEQIFYELTK